MAIKIKNDAPELMEMIPAMPHASQNWHCFKSPESAVEYLESTPKSAHWNQDYLDSNDAIYGGVTTPGAYRLCREGWQDGATRVAKLRDKINAAHPVARPITTYGVAGSIPNVQRALAGNPMHMKRADYAANKRRPIITLINHMGGRAMVPAECFVNKCGVVAAIVDSIEAAGFSCHVLGVSQSDDHAQFLCGFATTVKAPGDSVDTGRLAFAMGHVGMFRRIVWNTRTSDHDNKRLTGTLGSTVDFKDNAADGVYVLPSMITNYELFKTEETAATKGLAHMIAALRSQGCPAFPELEQAA